MGYNRAPMPNLPFQFGPKSETHLANGNPALVRVVRKALSISPIDFTIVDSLRTPERQISLVASGASQTMNSRHLPGPDGKCNAFDIAAWLDTDGDGDKEISWHMEHGLLVASAIQQAARIENVSVRWGGVWKIINTLGDNMDAEVAVYVADCARVGRKPFLDFPHFEVPAGH